MKEELFDSFFKEGAEFWIGKVVAIEAQKTNAQGFSWGWRYKVRIFGTYSENDNVPDDQVHNATVLFGVTDGSGFAGRLKSCKIAQHDLVFGFFMAEDEGYPVIIGLLSPTKAYNKFVEKFRQRKDITYLVVENDIKEIFSRFLPIEIEISPFLSFSKYIKKKR